MLASPGPTPDKTPGSRPKSSLVGLAWRLARNDPGRIGSFLREEYRRRWGIPLDRRFRRGLSGLPVQFGLNLTRRCNLKCLMCEQHRHQPGARGAMSWYDPARELPLAAWIGLLDQVASFRPQLYLTGGEPLLYPHFAELIQEAKKRRLPMHLQTNGTLLGKMSEQLVAAGVEVVTVSLDGPAEVHDRIRGQQGAFHRSQEGIAALRAARGQGVAPLLRINCVISKDNLSSLEQMVPLALDAGADILQLQHTIFNDAQNVARHNRWLSGEFARKQGIDLVPPSIPDGEFYESEITGADLPRLRAALAEARRLARGRLQLMFLPRLPEALLDPYYLDLKHPFPQVCPTLWKTCRIMPDGTVSPCLHLVAGNIARQPFREIWNGPGMQRIRQLVSQRLFPGCARCCNRSFT